MKSRSAIIVIAALLAANCGGGRSAADGDADSTAEGIDTTGDATESSGDPLSDGQDPGDGDEETADAADVDGEGLDTEGDEGPVDPCLAVPGRIGIMEQGDPLWDGERPLTLAYDFDGDGCVDGRLSLREGSLDRLDLEGSAVWTARPSTTEGVNGGVAAVGDWSGDGVLDVIAVATEPTGGLCGEHAMLRTLLVFVDGATGAVESPASALDDLCWTFPTATYPTRQYYTGSPVIADFAPSRAGREVVLFPYYATMGWVLSRATGSWIMLQAETDPAFRHLYYPSTSAFDAEYNATNPSPCMLSPWGGGACYVQNSHVANPVMTGSGTLLVLTSGRAVSIRPDLSPTGDWVWAAGGRTDHAGRNYGLVTRFTMAGEEQVTLHGGCRSAAMIEAMRAADLTTAGDPLCGIHRHYEIFTLASGVVTGHLSRFYSYAPSPGVHEGRLQFPRNAVFSHGPSDTVWTAYSLYSGGSWHVRVTNPLTPDAPVADEAHAFLWDVRDLDGDGAPSLLISRLPAEAAAGSLESLVPPWSMEIASFDGAQLVVEGVIDGWVPAMPGQPNRDDARSSEGALHPAAVTDLENDGVLEIVVTDAAGAHALVGYGGAGWSLLP